MTPFATTPRDIFGVTFSADGREMALTAATPTTLPEVYRSAVASSFSRHKNPLPPC